MKRRSSERLTCVNVSQLRGLRSPARRWSGVRRRLRYLRRLAFGGFSTFGGPRAFEESLLSVCVCVCVKKMLRTKQDVDRHVVKTLAKLRSDREKCFRGHSIARLYFEIGDYETCVRYLTQYLTVKDNNAAAHCLLGQAYRKLGRKEEALAEFKTSLELDATQSNLVLKVCELLSEETTDADPGCMRFWVDHATAAFPRHPTLFRLNQRLLRAENADSSTIATLLKEQIAARPSHPPSHARLLQHFLQYKQFREAFDYAYDIHTSKVELFEDSFIWLDSIVQVVDAYKSEVNNLTDSSIWNYWLLHLTVLERKTYLQVKQNSSIADTISTLKSFNSALYDISVCQKLELKDSLLKHFGAQFCFYGGSLMFMKALNNQIGWREAVRCAAPFFLLAFQIESPDTQRKDLSARWSTVASYRMSQAGHTISISFKDKKRLFLDNISQYFSDKTWRNKFHKDLFGNADNSKLSYILNPKSFIEPNMKFPNLGIELQQADLTSRLFSRASLHFQTWIGLNIDKLSKLTSLDTDELPWNIDNLSNCGPETLCKFDLDAFLYCTTIIAQKNIESNRKLSSGKGSLNQDRPSILPEMLMDPLCSAEQAKWWECVEFSLKRDSDSQNSDIRTSLIRGIETIRCIGNHGIDPYLLHAVAKVFAQRAEIDAYKKTSLLKRAKLYYENALILLEKHKDRVSFNSSKNVLFNFTSRDASSEQANFLIEDAKLFLGSYYMENNESDKAIDILTSVKSPYASFYLFQVNMKLADEQKNLATPDAQGKRHSLLSKARKYIYITLDKIRNDDSQHPLSEVIDERIENVERQLSSLNVNFSMYKASENDELSDQQSSVDDNNPSESTPVKYHEPFRISSTSNSGRTQMNEMKRKEFVSDSVLQQISALLESNKLLTEQVCEFKSALNEIKSQNMNAVDRRKFFSSVDDIRCKVDELREESCINTMDLKREINDLRKDLEKLKISAPAAAQRPDDTELLLLEETFKNNSAALSYLSRVNNGNPAIPPANPYSLYPSNLYPLYAGQFPHVFPPATLFSQDQTLYSDLLVPPQVQPQPQPQPPQTAIHDYHIPLPTQNQPVAPSILSSQPTSTPNKPILDVRVNAGLPKTFNMFDTSKSNSLFDTSKSSSILDTSKSGAVEISKPFSFNKDKSDNLVVNKSRTLSEKSNDSYDPLPDYQPMVPLPAEIVPTTGEEGEEILFDARAKLYRFVDGEWKERGLGQLKLLKNESTEKVRLLMRRDIVHTVCANHIISPEIELSPMKGTDKAYFWAANDFADEVVKLEKFSVRFKTVEIGKKFFETFNNSKNQALNTIHDVKAEKSKAKDTSAIELKSTATVTNSFGGFTFSTAPTLRVVEKDSVPVTSVSNADNKPNPFAGFSFTKPPASMTNSNVSITNTFQITAATRDSKITQADTTTSATTTTTFSGWGDKFKPKAGSWNCTICYITNDSTNSYCVACDNPKEPGMPKKEEIKPSVDLSKFTFGFPVVSPVSTSSNDPVAPLTSVTNVEKSASNNTFKFGFGTPTSTPATKFSFGQPQITSPNKSDNQPFILGAMDNTKYDFAFTPKTVPKSPNKSLNESVADDNDTTQEDEGQHIFFEPVVPMPDKVDVKTGEEDENILYIHRAKLFRFCDSEWKECGVGDVKILQHKMNQKIRLLMRREPVMKICLNHYLTEDIEYLHKDEKTWLFSACDFSTGEVCPQQFCIRFVNKGVAEEFKTAVEDAKKSLPGCRGCETESNETSLEKNEPITDSNSKKNDENRTAPFTFNFNVQSTLSEVVNNNKTIFSTSAISAPIFGTGLGFGSQPTFNMANSTSIFNTNTPSPFNPKSAFNNSTTSAPTLEALLKNNQPKSVSFKSDNNASITNDNTNSNVKFGSFGAISPSTIVEAIKMGPNSEVNIKNDQKNPITPENPITTNTKDLQNHKSQGDDDVIFVSESRVSEKEISDARKLMLPDKFYSYKDLPLCSGCRGCENESETVEISKSSSVFPTFTTPSAENKVSTGTFNFENFSISKTTTQSLFGGNTKATTTISSVSTPAVQSIFGTTTTPIFGSGMIFGSKSQTVFNTTAQSLPTVTTQNESIFKPQTNIFNALPFSTNAPVNTQITTTSSSGLFERLLASGEITEKSTFEQNGDNKLDQDKTSTFWSTKTPYSFGNTDKKVTDKSYEDVSDDEQPADDDGQHIFFKPQIPLPDEVEVKTGEEQEEVVYSHRSKLYRYADSEWKECGVGDVKILHHLETNKLRVLMRREPIMKVCLNHLLTHDVNYLTKDEKSWLFSVCDFSTGEITPQQFCIRFANKNIAQEFLTAINDARNKYNSPEDIPETNKSEEKTNTNKNDSNESTKVEASTEKPNMKSLIVTPKLITSESFPSTVVNPKSSTSYTTLNMPPVFGSPKTPLFNNTMASNAPIFGSGSVFGNTSVLTFENLAKDASDKKPEESSNLQTSENLFAIAAKQNQHEEKSVFNSANKSFTWEGAGTPLFSSAAETLMQNKNQSVNEENTDHHDPQFQPIVPLPDKIEVITGEEEEIVEFGQRCKLFRFSNSEWRERGIGELKILHHPVHGTYRMLLRQEQVFKVVLNQLITNELDMLPMPNSPKALMWMGMNYTDDEKMGVIEKLAVRFRTEDLVEKFHSKIKKIIEELPVPSSDEILVTDVPEEFIQDRYQDEEDCEDDDSDHRDENYDNSYYYNYDGNS